MLKSVKDVMNEERRENEVILGTRTSKVLILSLYINFNRSPTWSRDENYITIKLIM